MSPVSAECKYSAYGSDHPLMFQCNLPKSMSAMSLFGLPPSGAFLLLMLDTPYQVLQKFAIKQLSVSIEYMYYVSKLLGY